MKRIINLIAIFAVISLLLPACSNDEREEAMVDVKSIEFVGLPENDTIPLFKGDVFNLQVVTDPPNAPVRFYNASSDAFRVNQNTGEITALKGGLGTVIAIAPNGNDWTKAFCRVDVTELLERIAVTPNNVYNNNRMYLMSTTTLNVSSYFSAQPTTATDRRITYHSSDPAVATVNATTGVVTRVSKGVVEITARAADASGVVSEPIQIYSNYSAARLTTTPAWTATASSTQDGTNYTPARAIDNNTTSTSQFWHANWTNVTPHPYYLQVDLGSARTIHEIEIYRRREQRDTRDVEIYIIPSSVTIAAGLTWTDPRYELLGFISFGDMPASSSTVTQSIIYRVFPESVSARYFMLKFLNSGRNDGDQSLLEVIPRTIS